MSGDETMQLAMALGWFVVGIVALLFATQARRRGSSVGAWVVPAVGGILFILWGLFLLWGWAA